MPTSSSGRATCPGDGSPTGRRTACCSRVRATATPGGRCGCRTANWGLVRRIVSRGGCLYAQVLLGMRVRDLTGGFKCFRRAALEAIELEALSAHGYAFQIEATYRVKRAGLRIREVPITFVERQAGASKMTGSIVAEAMWRVPLLRLRALAGKL
jgi:dolichol-phosphate mannosyltransferase